MGWLNGWNKRLKLTIDQTKIDTANQLNFPVLVYLSMASGIGDVDVSCVFDELTSVANRKKIAVTTSDGITQCYVEIERWDDSNEKAWLWVKAPSVAYNSDTDLYLYYDSNHADNVTYVGDIGDTPAQSVWDGSFIGIWHMSQSPSGGSGCIKDSTSNANHGTPGGSMTSGDLVDGKIGKALDFDGSNDIINCGSSSSLDDIDQKTIEVIMNAHTYGENNTGRIFDKLAFNIDIFATDSTFRFYHGFSTTYGAWHSPSSSISTETLYSLSLTYDRTSVSNKPLMYIDGVSKTVTAISNPAGSATFDADSNFYLGNEESQTRTFDGILDEMRISDIIRTPSWIKATYHSNWDSLITFGSEEEEGVVSTDLFDGKVRIKDSVTDLFDGKVRIKDSATDLFDGKVTIAICGTDLFDGKVKIKDSVTNLFDGKACVKEKVTDQFDGKAEVLWQGEDNFNGKTLIKDAAIPQFDGKVAIQDVATDQFDGRVEALWQGEDNFDGKARIKDITTSQFNGKAIVIKIATNQFDGKARFYPARNLFDGKVRLRELIEGSIDLPFLDVWGNTGAIGDVTLPLFSILTEVFVGVDTQGNIVLPGLEAVGFTGARCNYNLPSLGISGVSTIGTIASGEVVLPIFNVEGQSFTDAIVNGACVLPALRISASSIHGSLCIGEALLPGFRVHATAKVGTVCIGSVELPCLIIEAEGGHIPTGEGNVVLPLLQVYSNASVLVDPRDGCHILRYSR